MEEKEAVYDEKISPLMKQILAICKEHQIPMFATFEFAGGQFCTSTLENDGHCITRHHYALAQCAEEKGVNIDKYMFWVAKQVKGSPHSSLVLNQIGIPYEPMEPSAI